MQEYKLVKYEGGLTRRVGNALRVTNKLLALGSRKDLIDVFVNNPWFFLHTVPAFYQFNEEFIYRFWNDWDWEVLNKNKSIIWSEILIDKCIKHLDYTSKLKFFKALSNNENIAWTEKLINKYIEMWDWEALGKNKSIPWSYDLINKYFPILHINSVKYFFHGLSHNDQIHWTESLIDKFIDSWDFGGLALSKKISWNLCLIKKYNEILNGLGKEVFMYGLSRNVNIDWTDSLISSFERQWNWNSLSFYISWTKVSIAKYYNRVLYGLLDYKKNYIELSLAIYYIKKTTHPSEIRMEWSSLSSNETLNWSAELIEKYQSEWDWYYLSMNKSLPWSDSLITEYFNKWNWNTLSNNTKLPWSELLIDKYLHKWNWSELSRNESLPWSEALVRKYKDYIDWSSAKFNSSLPWSMPFIKEYLIQWDERDDLHFNFEDMRVDWQKVFEPHVDGALIEEVMERVYLQSQNYSAKNNLL